MGGLGGSDPSEGQPPLAAGSPSPRPQPRKYVLSPGIFVIPSEMPTLWSEVCCAAGLSEEAEQRRPSGP
ncbi:hypothetical protein H8959_006162 [Pygathrix nigripes]